jgi:DNA end-binding protein Ku
VNEETGREVPWDRIVKGYEYEKGQYVLMSDQDFKQANVKATQTIDIEDFISVEELDPMLFEKPYYLIPQKNAEKGYLLLREALTKTKKVAIAKIVIRTKQHLCAVMARGSFLVLEILRFAHEIKDIQEAKDLLSDVTDAHYTAKELRMAEDLIDGMTASWDPDKYEDTYYNDVMAHIQKKIKAGQATEIQEATHEPQESSEGADIVDLMPLLKKSLEARKGGKRSRPRAGRAHTS